MIYIYRGLNNYQYCAILVFLSLSISYNGPQNPILIVKAPIVTHPRAQGFGLGFGCVSGHRQLPTYDGHRLTARAAT